MSDQVWIHAHVEAMAERDEYVPIPRAEWDAMTEKERDEVVNQVAADTLANAGDCGAWLVDDEDVPEEWK